jgi:ATP-dependent DNA helicase RecG
MLEPNQWTIRITNKIRGRPDNMQRTPCNNHSQDSPMSTSFQQLANFIWSVTDLLRGPYPPPQYETGETTLKRIEPHRLAALVLEDLQRYPESAISDIRQRIGGEIHPKQVKRALEELIERSAVRFEGNNRWRRYWATS